MNLLEAKTAVRETTKESFKISSEIWFWDDGRIHSEILIWVDGKHYRGGTIEQAVKSLKHEYQKVDLESATKIIEQVEVIQQVEQMAE